MKVSVRYFASIREAVGQSEEQLDTTATTLVQVRDELIARGGVWAQALARERAVRAALDHSLCDESCALHEGCEVAFFPPVTGG